MIHVKGEVVSPIKTLILIDGEPWRTFSKGFLRGWKGGKWPSFEDFEEEFSSFETKKAREVAIRKLSRKAYFKHELLQALILEGVNKEMANETIRSLSASGYLDDEVCKQALFSGAIRRGKSPRWVEAKLYTKGAIKNSDSLYTKDALHEVIRRELEKKRGKGEKAIASLVRKGFPLEDVLAIYREKA